MAETSFVRAVQPDSDSDASVHEFPCGSCGAKLKFAPGTDALRCPYCGAEQNIETSTKPIVEYDLASAREQIARGTTRDVVAGGHTIECSGCGARAIVATASDHCAFCGSPVVVEAADEDLIVPQSLLPFGIDARAAKKAFKKWVASRWFAPNDLIRRAHTKAMDGVYLPYWTFDSVTTTRYAGQRGDHYWETESYTDSEGKRQTRSVRKTRWRSASGAVSVGFDDVLVCASKTLPRQLIRALEPWDLAALRHYDPAYAAGFVTERMAVELDEGFHLAEERMEPLIRSEIRRDIGGDTQRIFSMQVRHENTTFKHLLLPLWLSSFRYGDRVFRVMVNARTGEVAGERPWSAVKIALAVAAGLAVIGGLVWLYLNRG